ncbi:hypothetical protein TNCV_1771001 [Trichonephila clavipes]|nr:hypothetical protein TNCV_1771001 [Trichonephila clavipes]
MALRNKDSAMNKMSRCRTRNLAPVHFRRGRECDCEFRTNRTLMRPWAEFCGLSMISDEGMLWIHPWCLKGSFLAEKRPEELREQRVETREAKRLLRREKKKKKEKRREREEPVLGWRKGKSPALDGEGMRGEPWLERTERER